MSSIFGSQAGDSENEGMESGKRAQVVSNPHILRGNEKNRDALQNSTTTKELWPKLESRQYPTHVSQQQRYPDIPPPSYTEAISSSSTSSSALSNQGSMSIPSNSPSGCPVIIDILPRVVGLTKQLRKASAVDPTEGLASISEHWLVCSNDVLTLFTDRTP
ncbi:hypothetical protein K435DRAFT_317575 [Dendrothele bispora CBS 962.96]|uniref:Uncharacterized protein n=1 Tax=Dendrothele bispora (strain CBS 962.96) TaxID=1314807 RepID=A0A4S8LGK5_DENBC|nr:hypothetical protein K435DRAFT_61308 [Dendrothele bispora CBS 962.96]THU88139.1 hypothetical protein K435DRAFT_317575 [Dendrothele bispora CBS 962.96]